MWSCYVVGLFQDGVVNVNCLDEIVNSYDGAMDLLRKGEGNYVELAVVTSAVSRPLLLV